MVGGERDGDPSALETPEMRECNPASREYVAAWLRSGPGQSDEFILSKAEEYAAALAKRGYGSRASLLHLTAEELNQVQTGQGATARPIPPGIQAILLADLDGRMVQRRLSFAAAGGGPPAGLVVQWEGGPSFPTAGAMPTSTPPATSPVIMQLCTTTSLSFNELSVTSTRSDSIVLSLACFSLTPTKKSAS